MKSKILSCAVAVFAMAVAANSQATLIGSTVAVTNSPASALDGTFLVVDGLERSLCLVPSAGTCLLGIDFDVGPDYITYHSFNVTPVSLTLGGNTITHTFTGAPRIIGAELLSNTLPTTLDVSFTDNTVTYVTGPYVWAAGSEYANRVAIRTVPEPATLSLIFSGLLALLAAARRGATIDPIETLRAE